MSADVLAYQVPMVPLFFADTGATYRKVITLTVGGNDLLLGFPTGLNTIIDNLPEILAQLALSSPSAHVYVSNIYDPGLGPQVAVLVQAANGVIAQVVQGFNSQPPETPVTLVDIFSAFQGRSGLLLAEKHGAELGQVHPTNAGYGVMAKTFADAIKAH